VFAVAAAAAISRGCCMGLLVPLRIAARSLLEGKVMIQLRAGGECEQFDTDTATNLSVPCDLALKSSVRESMR
jgi:hypothetical protein